MTARRRRCTRCGELGAEKPDTDAAGDTHWFHLICYRELRWWLRGHDTPLPAKYRDPEWRGIMPLARSR